MVDLMKVKGLAAFWARGALAALDRACLLSFVGRGYRLTLYSYDPIPNLPKEISAANASDILSEEMLGRVRYNGRPDLAHFSDLFRYELIKRKDVVWIDVDMLSISDSPVPSFKDIIVKEEQGGINNAILYISDQRLISALSGDAMSKLDKELRWGETGPELLHQLMKRNNAQSANLYNHEYFYPLDHCDVWKLFLPSKYDECRDKCSKAVTIHLFNNILSTMGYWKELAPPKGSFLYERLDDLNVLTLFSGIYPEKIMTACIENFRFRQNGKALGVKTLVREFCPSIARTWRHYRK